VKCPLAEIPANWIPTRGEQVTIKGLLPSVFSRQPQSARPFIPDAQCSLFDRFSGPYGGLLLYKNL
jgi:hypothetical protein